MTPVPQNKAASPTVRKASAEMMKHGIVRVPVDYFHFGEFRYTNVDDAIAYAKRKPASG